VPGRRLIGGRVLAGVAAALVAVAVAPEAYGQAPSPEPPAEPKSPELSPEAARQGEEPPEEEPVPDGDGTTDDGTTDDGATDDGGTTDASATDSDAKTDAGIERRAAGDTGGQELSGSIGAEMGGRVSPGGLHVGGAYLYQLSEQDWFDGGLAFTFGSSARACFRDRDGDTLCDHGVTDGFGGEVSGGVRRYFPGQGRFTPYARVAIALRLVSYGGDDVRGFAIPLEAGGGVRAAVSDRISIAGGAELRLGPAWFNSDLGTEPHLGLAIHVAAEMRL
jgi:hypothetical protein